jgi:hypothetical protein
MAESVVAFVPNRCHGIATTSDCLWSQQEIRQVASKQWIGTATSSCSRLATTTRLRDSKRLEREIEERSRKSASGGVGESAAGALLGGLLLGPFGMYQIYMWWGFYRGQKEDAD